MDSTFRKAKTSFIDDIKNPFYMLSIKKKLTLRFIVMLMAINILVSIGILKQQSKMTFFFDNYYNHLEKENSKHQELLTTLNAYRSFYVQNGNNFKTHRNVISENSLKIRSNSFNIDMDYLLNKNSMTDLFNLKEKNDEKLFIRSFYKPNILINNKELCKVYKNSKVLLIYLIHSHKNNFLRRQAMRDTWLSMNVFTKSELQNMTNLKPEEYAEMNATYFEIKHLFIVGDDQSNDSYKTLKLESDIYKDILMIDTYDTYQNLLYKHLTIINWVTEYCSNALYVMKLDDDVYVNIKPLSKHLLNKFGFDTSDTKFMYCNINEMALPVRQNNSKWYVDYDTYPFDYYPRYCEGFSYITNVPTMQLMLDQTKIIPRFWIDDVYFTGILLHGIEQIQWIKYTDSISWSYYDFWDHGNTLSIYEFYARFLKFFNINAIDYYKSDHFVILHVQHDNKEINYNFFNECYFHQYFINLFEKLKSKNKNDTKSGNIQNLKQTICSMQDLTSKFLCFLNSKNYNFNFHFYDFCVQLWKNKN